MDMERKFLEYSLLKSESSRGAKVPWNESSWTFRSPGANVPRNESSTGAKVLSVVFSLPGTKVQRNEKASYLECEVLQYRRYINPLPLPFPFFMQSFIFRENSRKVDEHFSLFFVKNFKETKYRSHVFVIFRENSRKLD